MGRRTVEQTSNIDIRTLQSADYFCGPKDGSWIWRINGKVVGEARIGWDGERLTIRDGERIVDHENIQRSRLRVDARKWAAARLAPRKYGDRVEHDHKGALNFQPTVLIQIGDGAPGPVEVSGKVIEAE